ncbi:precorrin-6Y C5,15-methyltransferase (decarboxylating) subunit CbiT [Mangrovibacterium marinum]|uniref:Cobalt-precorrin 7 C15-methyltransferase n=1 Tax=Mangrovibacterium marinum TaxID=1639118 RepID=A0A2T5C3B8_9BACT|nr:precorrin-6Y C5,15-methyltransferase (decarboxylating) subunit CbiT [Mangrovibacterium marinum]PTN09268.1 cobalt-precorrin 7 C15-methyltransferase [Mangrovibacterium marinum]
MKDSAFIRGSVPMTKEEVRTLVLSKLELQSNDRLMDIGAGTGSVSIEAALRLSEGQVIALERKPEAVGLIKLNAEKHGVSNIEIIESEAPVGMEKLDTINKYFIGGSGGQLEQILDLIDTNAPADSIVVLTAIVIDTMLRAYSYFKSKGWSFELSQVAISKVDTQSAVAMLKAQNPIFLFTATKTKSK